jgi:hypothetical protein
LRAYICALNVEHFSPYTTDNDDHVLSSLYVDMGESTDKRFKGFPIWRAFFFNTDKMKLIMTQPWNWNIATQHGIIMLCCCMACPEGGSR